LQPDKQALQLVSHIIFIGVNAVEGIMDTKICPSCKIELPLTNEYFYSDKYKKSGFASQCKICVCKHHQDIKDKIKIWSKQYYIDNKERINKRNQEYRNSHLEQHKIKVKQYCEKNRETRNEKNRQYRLLNKDKIQAKGRLYYEKNKERINAINRQWGKENRVVKAVSTQRYRAKSKSILSTLTKDQWEYIKLQFDNKCAYCGKKAILSQDHFIPQNNYGEHTHNNIIPSCKSCNSSKSIGSFFEWYPKYKYYSKTRERKILKFLGYKDGVQQLELVDCKLYNHQMNEQNMLTYY